MAGLACTLSVLHAPVAAGAKRNDVIGNRAGRQAVTEVRDATQRISVQDELAPLLVAPPITATGRRAARTIRHAARIFDRVISAHTAVARLLANAADSLR